MAEGKNSPLIILTMPGAFSSNQGAAVVRNTAPQAKLTRQPDETAERKTLSGRCLPFLAPTRDISSIVSAGVYDAMFARLATRTVCIVVVAIAGRGSATQSWEKEGGGGGSEAEIRSARAATVGGRGNAVRES